MRGKVRMMEGIMGGVKVNRSGKCNIWVKNVGSRVCGENRMSKIKGMSVGGKRIGKRMKVCKSVVIKGGGL